MAYYIHCICIYDYNLCSDLPGCSIKKISCAWSDFFRISHFLWLQPFWKLSLSGGPTSLSRLRWRHSPDMPNSFRTGEDLCVADPCHLPPAASAGKSHQARRRLVIYANKAQRQFAVFPSRSWRRIIPVTTRPSYGRITRLARPCVPYGYVTAKKKV